MRFRTIYLLGCALPVCLISCKTGNADLYKQLDSDTLISGPFKKDIPKEQAGVGNRVTAWIYFYTNDQARVLNLDSLGSGFDGLRIRIWRHYWMLNKRDVLIFSRFRGKWSGE